MVMFLPGMWASSIKNAAVAKPAMPPPTICARLRSMPFGGVALMR